MASVSGVRGIFGDTLTPDIVQKYSARFGILCNRGTIVIGRDSRTTGEAMLYSIVSGLIGVGCNVIDLGIVSTPTVLLAVEESDACGGISITASHNPPEWNAMKFVDSDGMFLSAEKASVFLNSIDQEIKWADWKDIGKITTDSTSITRHIDKVLSIPYVNYDLIRSKRFKVVVDSVNGAGGLLSPILLNRLGCEVIEINSEPTGIFAHPAEPLNHNLVQLEQAVKDHKADLGFATDPDVDRLSIVSNEGKCIGEELSVALCELYVLAKNPGDVVVNLSSSMISDYLAKTYGVNVHRTKVGEINVGKKMQAIKSPIGGEGNGGIICPDVHYTRDAMAGMALILALLAERNQTLAEVVDSLPKYFFAKDKITVNPSQLDSIMDKVPGLFEHVQIDTQDGIKVTGEGFWIHVRKSGTEPIIRVYVESDSADRSQQICKETITKLLA